MFGYNRVCQGNREVMLLVGDWSVLNAGTARQRIRRRKTRTVNR
ncbi:MAG: hypothetical protein ACRKGH_07275 [Dehalogenimonas sp.]